MEPVVLVTVLLLLFRVNGDLVNRMYMEFSPSLVCGTNSSGAATICGYVGNSLIDEVEVEIGGQRIDRQYGKWMTIWSDLTQINPSKTVGRVDGNGRYIVVNDSDGYAPPTQYQRTSFNVHGGGQTVESLDIHSATVPLEFWFCRNPGLALPLIALQYHEVKVNLTFEAHAGAISLASGGGADPSLDSVKLWADYIYLDTDERRRFAQVSHEYLIEQLQYQNFAEASTSMTLNFNHPVKEIIWTGAPKAVGASSAHNTSGPSTPQRMSITNNDSSNRTQALARKSCYLDS